MEERNCPWCKIELKGPEHVDKKDCIFCNFPDKEELRIYKDDFFIAFLSKAPLNKYHVIIIPKEHYTDTSEVPDEVLAKMYILAKKIAKAVKKAAKADGITTIHDDGITKTTEHFTLHILPRYKKDKICGHYVREEDPGLEVRLQYTKEIKQFL